MKRHVLVFGSIAGSIMIAMMLLNMFFIDQIGMEHGHLVGYTIIVLAFLLIFFGVRSYRDNVGQGAVSFGRAFAVGALIALVASAIYVAVWQVMYFGDVGGLGDFMERYTEHSIEQARADGATEAQLAAKRAEMERMTELYQNPIINAGITLLEPLPVGLVMALVSAGILRRRRQLSTGAPSAERTTM